MGWTFYNSSGQKLNTAATSIDVLDIDGATDIGAAIVDADLFIIDDGAGGTNRKTAASRLKTYAGTTQAAQSDIEAETNEDTYIPPDLIKHSPGVAKGYVRIDGAGAIVAGDYNVASITDTGAGDRVIVWDVDFSNGNYATVGGFYGGTNSNIHLEWDEAAAGSIVHRIRDHSGDALIDMPTSSAAFGDQ